ncbi:MAG: hypothetical protein ACTS7I_00060 [Candidatus Hodgkinia cicadicola]
MHIKPLSFNVFTNPKAQPIQGNMHSTLDRVIALASYFKRLPMTPLITFESTDEF